MAKVEAVAITTDSWTSVSCTSFVATTVHFVLDDKLQMRLLDCSSFHQRSTAVNLKDKLLDVLNDFYIKDKVICVVTDNAANVKKAVQVSISFISEFYVQALINPYIFQEANLKGMGCFAHGLNLAVSEALKSTEGFEKLRQKMSDLVTLLHRSHLSKDEFEACRVRLNLPKKVLIPDVRTRWNSVYMMLERYLELKDAVTLFQTKEAAKGFSFSPSEWQLAQSIMELLAPAYEATVEISGENFVSGSKVIPITKSLLKWYAVKSYDLRTENPSSIQTKFAEAMNRSLLHYLGMVEKVDQLALSTLCDPRYKKLAFRDSTDVSKAIQKFKEEITGRIIVTETSPESDPRPAKVGKSNLWDYFDSEVSRNKKNAPQGIDPVSEEIVRYLNFQNEPRETNPMTWWSKSGKQKFPNVHKLAMKMLIIPGTSVPSERVFSTAGNIINKKRALLSDQFAGDLIFLRENVGKKKM